MLTKSTNFTKLPLEPKLVSQSGRRKRHSIRLTERKTIRSVALWFVHSDMDPNIEFVSSNTGGYESFFNESPNKIDDFDTKAMLKAMPASGTRHVLL